MTALCESPEKVFGLSEIDISAGQILSLKAKSTSPHAHKTGLPGSKIGTRFWPANAKQQKCSGRRAPIRFDRGPSRLVVLPENIGRIPVATSSRL